MDWQRALGAPGVRRARTAGLVAVAVVLTGGAAFLLLPLVVRGFVRGIVLLLNGSVSVALSLSAGASAWSVLGSIGRAAATVLVTRQATSVLAVLVVVAAGALIGLQRLLGSGEEES